MKKFLLSLVLSLAFVVTFAQADTLTAPHASANWFSTNWPVMLGVFVGVYELVARWIPTTGNWSILSKIMAILKALIPNNKDTGGTHD